MYMYMLWGNGMMFGVICAFVVAGIMTILFVKT